VSSRKKNSPFLFALAISFCLMPELSTSQVSSGYWLSLHFAELVASAYFSDLNRP
jgi:hypothetical protein